ncbi:hypothetical protein ACI2IY_10960 [Lysobacter enzymogenes]|uniref:hypothetical protein n=1 Tax=Lysobacter enzymogenes TaxID=69 RepID=UPI00384D211B
MFEWLRRNAIGRAFPADEIPAKIGMQTYFSKRLMRDVLFDRFVCECASSFAFQMRGLCLGCSMAALKMQNFPRNGFARDLVPNDRSKARKSVR